MWSPGDGDAFGVIGVGASGGASAMLAPPLGALPSSLCDRRAAARRGTLLPFRHSFLHALQPRNYHLVEPQELMAPFTCVQMLFALFRKWPGSAICVAHMLPTLYRVVMALRREKACSHAFTGTYPAILMQQANS